MLRTTIGVACGCLAAALVLLLKGSNISTSLLVNLAVAGFGIAAALAALWINLRRNGVRPVRSVLAHEGGNVALIFGLGAMMLVMAVAFAIDLTRVVSVRSNLQDALDAATLAGARETTTEKMYSAADVALSAHTGTIKGLESLKTDFQLQGDTLVGAATADVTPIFMGLPPGKPFKIAADTSVERGIAGSLEVALVLDTTDSMNGASGNSTKLATLKAAAKDLVLKVTKDPKADVKIAVIPFGQYVNIGISRRDEPWANVPSDSQEGTQRICKKTGEKETYCSAWQQTPCTKVSDGVPYQSSCDTNVCAQWKERDKQICEGGYTTKTFRGCIGSPAYPDNVQDKNPSRLYPGMMNVSCGSEFLPLTNKQGPVISTIEGLKGAGNTYIPSGLAWGFNALSAPQPLKEAAPYDPSGKNMRPRKVIVLMTDGENTLFMRPANGAHDLTSPPSGKPTTQTNDFTLELCANAKAEKIEIYTIAFQVTNGPAKTMLQKCATDGSHYFDATDSQKLMDAFSSIAESLKSIFISS
jgi:Flp pilus assembly protein TadG